jgi:hypothetical protein
VSHNLVSNLAMFTANQKVTPFLNLPAATISRYAFLVTASGLLVDAILIGSIAQVLSSLDARNRARRDHADRTLGYRYRPAIWMACRLLHAPQMLLCRDPDPVLGLGLSAQE